MSRWVLEEFLVFVCVFVFVSVFFGLLCFVLVFSVFFCMCLSSVFDLVSLFVFDWFVFNLEVENCLYLIGSFSILKLKMTENVTFFLYHPRGGSKTQTKTKKVLSVVLERVNHTNKQECRDEG